MAVGKYLSLEEARRLGKLQEFAKEHEATGDGKVFDELFKRMASGEKPKKGTPAK
ncbi:MAG: hypothetical protein AB7P12_01985 [Alphaproteobacteria bacterium]